MLLIHIQITPGVAFFLRLFDCFADIDASNSIIAPLQTHGRGDDIKWALPESGNCQTLMLSSAGSFAVIFLANAGK